MQFFASAINTLQTLVIALGAGLGVWGVVNLLEGYGSDNPGAKSQGMKLSFGKLNDAPFFRLNETFLGIDSRYSAKYLQGFPHTV